MNLDLALAVWRRRKWLATGVFVLACAGAVAAIVSLPPLYAASATVLVERQQVSEALVRPSVTTELETRLQMIHKQVTSRARLSDVIARFNLYPELRRQAPIEAVVERMRRDIDFDLSGVPQQSGRTATIAFSLSYVGSNPYLVAEVTNTLVDSYVDENTRARERQAVRTAAFLKGQLDEAKRELESHEQREREYTLRHATELPQQMDVNLAALDRLNTQLRLNGEYQLRAIERRERFEQDAAAVRSESRVTPPPAPDASAAELARLKQQLADLSTKYSDRYPDVIRVKAAIAAAERDQPANGTAKQPEPETAVSARRPAEQALAHIDGELATLKKEEVFLRGLIAGYESRVENAPRRQDELQQLTRDYAGSKERYETLLKRYDEAKVAESLEQGQEVEGFRVLDAAVPPMAPTAPNRLQLLIMALAGSAALAFAAMVIAEKLDATFHNVDELRTFAPVVPTVAVIRRITAPSASRTERWRLGLATIGILAALAIAIGAGRYIGSGNEQLVRMTERGRG